MAEPDKRDQLSIPVKPDPDAALLEELKRTRKAIEQLTSQVEQLSIILMTNKGKP